LGCIRFEQSEDFRIARLSGELFEGTALGIAGLAKRWKSLKESTNPIDVASLDREREVSKLDPEKGAHLAEILNRPSRRRRPELRVGSVDCRALLHEELDDGAMPTKRCIVKGRCTLFIFLADPCRMVANDDLYVFQCTALCSIDQLFELIHRGPPCGRAVSLRIPRYAAAAGVIVVLNCFEVSAQDCDSEKSAFSASILEARAAPGWGKRQRERHIRYHTEWRLSSDGVPDAHMSLKAKLEAVIYAVDEPVMPAQLAALFADEALEWKAEQDAAAAEVREAAPETPQNSASQLNDAFPYLELEPVATGEAGEESKAAGEDVEDESSQSKRLEDSVLAPQETESLPETGEANAEPAAEPGPTDEAAIEAEAKRAAKLREREVRAVIRQLLDELIAEYAADGRGIEIREIAGGYRMATKPECHDAVRSFVKSQKPPLKLSMPALETLAVIAYKQPVTAPEVNEIRGVDSSGVFGSLLARKLITTAGRKPVVGRPILYKTTREFLLRFGLKDVSELPSMEEFEKMAASELEEPESEANAETAAPATEEFNPDLSVEQNEPAPESESNLDGSTQSGERAPGDPE